MKDKGIEVGSRIHIKKYDSNEVYQIIQITKCCQELRDSLKAKISILIKNFLRATLDINLELKKNVTNLRNSSIKYFFFE